MKKEMNIIHAHIHTYVTHITFINFCMRKHITHITSNMFATRKSKSF